MTKRSLGEKAEIDSVIESYRNHPSFKQIHNNLKLLEDEEKLASRW